MMKTVNEYSVLVGLELDVCYGAKSEMEALNDYSIAHVNVLVTNHNGNVVELEIMDWEFTDQVFFEEDEMIYTGFKLEGLTQIEEENKKRAELTTQYMINDLTVQEIIVNVTLNNLKVIPLKVNNYSLDVESIQEM